MTTQNTVKALFTIPESQDDKMIEWNIYFTKGLRAHNMITSVNEFRSSWAAKYRSRGVLVLQWLGNLAIY
jgi:hypothetical protein